MRKIKLGITALIIFTVSPHLSTAGPKLDARYESSPPVVVKAMLEMAGVRKTDIVYDLGCGDGRIVIEAARRYGARGIGVDLDPKRIAESEQNAKAAGVADRVKFINDNLFSMSLDDATVITLFLSPEANLKLRPKLIAELKPGSRIVSNSHDMGEWLATDQRTVAGTAIYLWVVPAT